MTVPVLESTIDLQRRDKFTTATWQRGRSVLDGCQCHASHFQQMRRQHPRRTPTAGLRGKSSLVSGNQSRNRVATCLCSQRSSIISLGSCGYLVATCHVTGGEVIFRRLGRLRIPGSNCATKGRYSLFWNLSMLG